MIYQESRQSRRIVGRIDEGDDCIDALTEFCDEHDIRAGEVRGVGQLSDVEVVRLDQEVGDYATVFDGEGTFDLLHLAGNVATMEERVVLRLEVVMAAAGPVGPQLVTGQLREGEVVDFEFVLESFDDLELERQLDGATGRLELGAIRRVDAADETSVEGQSMDWDDAAEASREAAAETSSEEPSGSGSEIEQEDDEESVDEIYGDLDFEEPPLDTGDVLDHPKLGRCRVMKLEDGQYAHVRLPRGKIRKLSLDVLDLSFQEEDDDGRKIFEAEVGQ